MDDLIPEDAETGCLIVAHPDDEALWCGGLLARRDLIWTVICCSIPHSDPIRAYKFFRSCEMLGAAARLLPFGERAGLFRVNELDLSEFYDHIAPRDGGKPKWEALLDYYEPRFNLWCETYD